MAYPKIQLFLTVSQISMYDKVFISYAKEDYRFAEKLYSFLEERGFKPWLDKKRLLPGQDWSFTIKQSLKEANYIVLLLSNISVQKRGYVQREFKLALEYYEEKLDDDIYLIPLKIDDCSIPERLSKFQWVEYSDADCFELVCSSLDKQREKYLDFEKKLIAAKEHFAYNELQRTIEYKSSIQYNIALNYIQFEDNTHPGLEELNSIITGKLIDNVVSIRKEIFSINGEIKSPPGMNWEFEFAYTANLISKNIISIQENLYYFFGGAHGNWSILGLNYYINPVIQINIEDLFDEEDHAPVLKFISEYCYTKLYKIQKDWYAQDSYSKDLEPEFWEDSLTPKWNNFKYYFISKNSIDIIFNTYSVSGFAFGIHTVEIPYKELLNSLAKPEKLNRIIEALS